MTEQQTVAELMKPRLEVIADYPNSPFDVGEMLEESGNVFGSNRGIWGGFNNAVYKPERWPNLFRRLEWWEKREPEEMPKFLKLNDRYEHFKGMVIEVGEYRPPYMFCVKGNTNPFAIDISYTTPATSTEYEAYQKSKG